VLIGTGAVSLLLAVRRDFLHHNTGADATIEILLGRDATPKPWPEHNPYFPSTFKEEQHAVTYPTLASISKKCQWRAHHHRCGNLHHAFIGRALRALWTAIKESVESRVWRYERTSGLWRDST